MPVTLQAFGLDRLSVEDRLTLVHALWDSIATTPQRSPLSDALGVELDRRLAEHHANPGDVIPWEQVEAEALARMKR